MFRNYEMQARFGRLSQVTVEFTPATRGPNRPRVTADREITFRR